jgi:hypothetical protein
MSVYYINLVTFYEDDTLRFLLKSVNFFWSKRALKYDVDLEGVLVDVVQQLHQLEGELHHEQGQVLVTSSALIIHKGTVSQ